jgi:hypothetical protein
MKGLVVCDPRGSVIFASMLFSGGISDKDIFVRSKFKEMLGDLLDEGYLLQGDGLMADKGFNIEEEVEKCGLQLNIPPFATIGKQMLYLPKKLLNIEFMLREQLKELNDLKF